MNDLLSGKFYTLVARTGWAHVWTLEGYAFHGRALQRALQGLHVSVLVLVSQRGSEGFQASCGSSGSRPETIPLSEGRSILNVRAAFFATLQIRR